MRASDSRYDMLINRSAGLLLLVTLSDDATDRHHRLQQAKACLLRACSLCQATTMELVVEEMLTVARRRLFEVALSRLVDHEHRVELAGHFRQLETELAQKFTRVLH